MIRQVAVAIEATAHHSDVTVGGACEPWVQWVLDLDLKPIASSRQRFMTNGSRLRSEQSYLSATAWQAHARQFYSALQRRDQIFHFPWMATAFEANARRHLLHALHHRNG